LCRIFKLKNVHTLKAFLGTTLFTSRAKRALSFSVVIALMGTLLPFSATPSSATSTCYVVVNGELTDGRACSGDVVIDSSVTSIGKRSDDSGDYGAFQGSTITSVTIPSTVTEIKDGAFYDAVSLRTVNFAPNSQLESIGYGAFFRATSLESIDIPSGVRVIDESAFHMATSLEFITFAPSATPLSIGHSAFRTNDLLETISFPSRVVSIGDYAFYEAESLEEVTFAPNSQIETIGVGAFSDAGALKSVTFAANSQLQTIGDFAFARARSLRYIEIPRLVTDLGDCAFCETDSLTSITFAQNSLLSRIGEECFAFSALTSITIPSNVEFIGAGAFGNADELSRVYFLGDEPSIIQTNAFINVANSATVIVQPNASGFDATGDPARWNLLIVLREEFTPPLPLYRNWQTPLSAITNGPKAGETVYASAFERELPRTLYKDENDYRANTTGYPTPEEYVYRITKQPNVPATSVDHQSSVGYDSLSGGSQDAWYEEIGFTEADPYQFTWKAFMCVPQSGSELTKPTGISLSYASREDGLLSDGSINGAHNLMFKQAATDWHQNLNLGQTLRSAVGFLPPDFVDTYTRSFLGDLDPAWHSLIWGILDLNASCDPGKELQALTITDPIGSPITTKSFDIPAQLNLQYDENIDVPNDERNFLVSSAGVTIGVTGRAPRRDFNAALWGLTTIADSNATPLPTQDPTPPTTTPPTSTQAPTTSAAISPVLTNKSMKLKVSFSERSSKLSAKEKKKLLRVVANVGSKVTGGKVIGYVQLDGNASNDRKLSTARARAVAKFLADNGIKVRLVTKGKGALNNKESSRRANITLRYAE
jgi:outer membrane protein OmpA-like peptidoglycan-associated protein